MDTRAKWSYFAQTDNCHLKDGRAIKDSRPDELVSSISDPAACRARICSMEVCFLKKGYAGIHDLAMEKEKI